MGNATIEKAVTFSSFPVHAHKTYADNTAQTPAPKLAISTQIHADEIQKSHHEELFGNVNCCPSFAAFCRPSKAAGAVFMRKPFNVDLDTVHDLLQDFISSQVSLAPQTRRETESIEQLYTTCMTLERDSMEIYDNMGRMQKG
ncbi:MAG TPA: hypothetical protein PLO43_02390 [Chlamydiales bacterium]|nr:hypothetical protein [Chlamydiales bacterium]HPE85012.1 hypothetical protein [Chlamydiales bacterium]